MFEIVYLCNFNRKAILMSKSKFSFPFILFICYFFSNALFSQKFTIQIYTDKTGYSAPETHNIFEDYRGNLWLGGVNGITRYDGSNFTNYNKTNGLIDNAVGGIIEDENKNLIIMTKIGFCLFDGKSFKKIPIKAKEKNSFKEFYIKRFFKSKKKEIYALGLSGLYKYNRTQKCFEKDEFFTFYVNQIAEDNLGRMLVATRNGIFVRINNKWGYSKLNQQLENKKTTAIAIDKKGNKWIGTTTSLLRFDSNDKLFDYQIPPNAVYDIKITSDNVVIAAGSMAKVYIVEDKQIETIDLVEYIATTDIHQIKIDYQDNIWLASTTYLIKMTKSPFYISDKFKNLVGPYSSMCSGANNKLYLGTTDGLYEKIGDKAEKFKPSNDPNDLFITALTFHDNKLYVGTFSGRFYIFENKKFKLILDNNGEPDCIFYVLFVDKNEFWVCTGTKVLNVKNGKVKPYKITPHFTQSALLDSKGKLWFANLDKLVTFENNKFKTVPGTEIYNEFVTVTEDENGAIWVGTYGNGILRIKDKKIKQFTKIDGLTNDFICSAFYDSTNNVLWVGTMFGVSKLKINENSDIVSFNRFLNTQNTIFTGCIQNAILKLNDGSLLISIGEKIFEYSSEQFKSKKTRLKIDFTDFKVNNATIKAKDSRFKMNNWTNFPENPIFKHYENNLEFNFHAVNFLDDDDVKYSWKLEGYDTKWITNSYKKSINYTNLPAGNYCFKVKAINSSGISSKTIYFNFKIKLPFYKTFWFITCTLLFFGGMIYFLVTFRINKIKRETNAKMLNFQKLAESELKALRAQMNPHFMFNTINSIQEIVLGNDDKTARIYFADFAKMMRMILENSTQKLISLEKEIDFLNLYLSFEKVRFKDKFEIELVVDDLLETATIKLPSMLIQPFIENAINHGLLHKENNGRLKVKFEEVVFESEAFLKCTIEDNGIGREAAMSLNKWKEKDHQSISTTVNSERIELLNTIMENKKFYLFITDLKAGELATGTKVELLISI